MATTPKSPPLSTGTTSPASRYTVTPTSTAALGAAKSAIKQATGTAPPSTFTVGSTMSVSQAAPGAKFTQGSTTTPTANKAAASTPAQKNTGTSQSNVLQSILGIAPLAAVGLSVYNKVSQGVAFTSTINNIKNAVSSLFSVGNSQNPSNNSGFVRISPPDQFAPPSTASETPTFRTPGAAHVDAPAAKSTANETPSFRTPGAAHVDAPAPPDPNQDAAETARLARQTAPVTPSTNSTNNVQDPAQRAQIADQVATDNAKSISNVQDPAQRAQAREAVATFKATPVNETDAETNRLVRANTAADIQVQNQAAPASGVDEESAFPPNPINDPIINQSDAETNRLVRANTAADIQVQNQTVPASGVDEESAFPPNTVAQQSAEVDELSAYPPGDQVGRTLGGAMIDNPVPPETKINPHEDAASYNIESPTPNSINNVQDPAQRGQIADQVAIDQAKTINNVQDPAQRAQAREVVENYKAPPVDETDAETARLARANTAADIEIKNAAPATEIDEESAYPPNPKDQVQPEIDEESAYPPNPKDQVDVNEDPAETARLKRAEDAAAEAENNQSEDPNQSGAESNRLALRNTQAAQTEQVTQKFKAQEDWRVRLSLAPGANYLYKVAQGAAGILNPLQATEGVIFPYTPAISVSYNAAYDATEVTHSNYKFFSYKSSNVDNITITADFTAQDTSEAQYLLAVIHFFRSVTKMFYGKDPGPGPGVPPPLCYLSGLGSFQFDWHPLVINNFTYTLPTDVDYIRAMDTSSRPGINVGSGQPKGKPGENVMAQRMAGSNIQTGALAAPPKFKNDSGVKDAVTYVPTKMSITIQAHPIISRNDISNSFSLKEYATGALLRGSQRQSGGIW